MALWSRKRKPSKEYVEPPEYRAGVMVLFDGSTWRVSPSNAADGAVPTALPEVTDLTGERLADEFRAGWLRALDGMRPALPAERWIRALDAPDAPDEDPVAAWGRFFTGGGAVFRIAPSPAGGIAATRYAWGWPASGRADMVRRSDRTGDHLAIEESRAWRTAIEDEASFRRQDGWARAAAWMRDRSAVDFRVAAWWIARDDGSPGVPVMTGTDAVEGLRVWWSGDASPTGSAIVDRYGLVAPAGNGFWDGWLRWDPVGSPRPDGPADVLGLRRAGRRIDVVWWPGEPGGGFGRPLRAVGDDGGPLDIDRVERLLSAVVVLERRPPDVQWVEEGGSP
ncbi:hypothetical protein ACNTMW_20210 [Planosporangium sp. 12N6]|uniref:hypothetical protein n=1 Tax=Planosporangium spinosum TaxID=3402278 RepID=UPI003CF2E958